MKDLAEFKQGCFDALGFTDMGQEDEAFGLDLSDESRERLEADCHSFWSRVSCYVTATDMTPAQAGHDFWLTRNRHGAGFWDGDWDHTPYASMLDKIAQGYGELCVYAGDDGYAHLS